MTDTAPHFPELLIQKPCPENWDTMAGDGASRFCEHCQKDVHQLDALPLDEQSALLAKLQQGERLCVRIPLTEKAAPPATKSQHIMTLFNWRASVSAAASLLFCILLSSCADATKKEPCPVNTNTNGHPEYKMGKPMSSYQKPAATKPADKPPEKPTTADDPSQFIMGEIDAPPPKPEPPKTPSRE